MDTNQQQMLLKAIAVSSLHLPNFSPTDRQQAFVVLEDFKKFHGRVAVCLNWLHTENHSFMDHDITMATKLMALEICSSFLHETRQQGSYSYSALGEADRLSFRQAIVKAARLVQSKTENRILARKLAAILGVLVLRDFPQRWTSFPTDIFSPSRQGGLWYDEPGPQSGKHLGVKICLECLRLVAEDCTDSDYNAKIPTSRRNDVLKGLNEVSTHFLPLLFQLLEHYPLLQQANEKLYAMHAFLVGQNRTINSMVADEALVYKEVLSQAEDIAQMIADTLVTLQKFCYSMPISWIVGGKADFTLPLLHFLRVPDAEIQVKAVDCLDQLVLRGKLDFVQWIALIARLPPAVNEANHISLATEDHRQKQRAATGVNHLATNTLSLQLNFHIALSRLLANVLASHIALITSNKSILEQEGNNFHALSQYLRLTVDVLRHPSGRIASEQINMWTTLMRDPQITKARLLKPYIGEILSTFMDHMVRIRWDDIDNHTHPQTLLIEASFDDEDTYDTWMSDFRSRASLFFRLAGSEEPGISSQVLNTRVQSLLQRHRNGEPLNFLDPSNGQLTPKSDAVMQFEGLFQPLDNIMSGIPQWAIVADNATVKITKDSNRRRSATSETRAALAELCQSLVAWQPTYLWLKFRRASLLDPLKYYWVYEPSTLLQAIDSLLQYLALPDEWQPHTIGYSEEITGLKKKSGVSLVAISKKVPKHLVPWLSQLSDAARSLLASSSGMMSMNQMHLYEFLSCVATAVDDAKARADFIGNVLASAIEAIESPDVRRNYSSAEALLETLGVARAATNPAMLTDDSFVREVSRSFYTIFNAFNELLSVGRRCHDAARKSAPFWKPPEDSGLELHGLLNFPDEGPVSLQDLAFHDPFVPLWPRILPAVLNLYEATVGIWQPKYQSTLLENPYQRYVYVISDEEFFSVPKSDSSVIQGASRKDINLVPKWSGWLNELRNTCFQMIGLLAAQRVMFSPEVAPLFPRLVSVISGTTCLTSMEHRHYSLFMKHTIATILMSCPSTLYRTHLEPIFSPVLDHLRFRLDKTWACIINTSATIPNSFPASTKALSSADCVAAAAIALRGGDEWLSWYYGHACLFVGDLDTVTAEAVVEKYRVDLSRTFSDVLQLALALKGDWALVLANQAKEDQSTKKTDPAIMTHVSADIDEDSNVDGKGKGENQALLDARKLQRINGLCHFLLLESEHVALNLTLTVVQCLGYPDAYTCRRITKICHRILETVAWAPQYSQILGQHMFTQAIKNIVTEPKWMVGIEWDVINVIRDIYCRLVLGQVLQFGGQGPGLQQTQSASNPLSYEQTKTADRPLQGGGILPQPYDVPRQILSSLPGCSLEVVREFEDRMKNKRAAKDQKDFIRELLRTAANSMRDASTPCSVWGAAASMLDRAVEEESLLHSVTRKKDVPDLPEKLVLQSQILKQKKAREEVIEEHDLSAFKLF